MVEAVDTVLPRFTYHPERSRLDQSSLQVWSVSPAESPEDGYTLGQRIVKPSLMNASAHGALRMERLISSLESNLLIRQALEAMGIGPHHPRRLWTKSAFAPVFQWVAAGEMVHALR
jgi:hypothetical protein